MFYIKKMFLKILQNSYENICVGVFFIKNFFVKKRLSDIDVFLWILQNL